MKSFTILSFVLATILGLLQFGWETDAVVSPIPSQGTSSEGYYVYVYAPKPTCDYSYQPYSYQPYSYQQYTYQPYSYQPYSYQQVAMSQYYRPQYSMPQYSMPQYSLPQYSLPQYTIPQYVPQVQAPSYIAPQLPNEFEGLYDQNAIVGDNNVQFTGVDILGDVNLPLNVLSATDVLN